MVLPERKISEVEAKKYAPESSQYCGLEDPSGPKDSMMVLTSGAVEAAAFSASAMPDFSSLIPDTAAMMIAAARAPSADMVFMFNAVMSLLFYGDFVYHQS